MTAHRIQQIEGAERVHVEIHARVGHRGRHRDLRREMDHGIRLLLRNYPIDRPGVAHVDPGKLELGFVAQPGEVALCARARKVVEHGHLPVSLAEIARGIAADKPGAPGN